MIKFVIIENDKQFQRTVSDIIDSVVFKTDLSYIFEKYDCYNKSLQNTIENQSCRKVFLLDTYFEYGKSGIDIAKEIRKHDWDSEIIFITSHLETFKEAHYSSIKVFDFIEKFHDMEARLINDIKLIINQKDINKKFCYETRQNRVEIYLKEIKYIYKDTREKGLIIQTNHNKIIINMTLSKILAKLDERFKQVHRACIVNDDRVQKYHWTEGYFILDCGLKVNMCSRKYR